MHSAALSARPPAPTPCQPEFPSRGSGLKQPTASISVCASATSVAALKSSAFTNKLKDVYFDQALVLPPGAVGTFLGSEQIICAKRERTCVCRRRHQSGSGASQFRRRTFQRRRTQRPGAAEPPIQHERQLHLHSRAQPVQRSAAECRRRHARRHRLPQSALSTAQRVSMSRLIRRSRAARTDFRRWIWRIAEPARRVRARKSRISSAAAPVCAASRRRERPAVARPAAF